MSKHDLQAMNDLPKFNRPYGTRRPTSLDRISPSMAAGRLVTRPSYSRSIYLNLGYQPFLYLPDMEARWRAIYAQLGRTFRIDG